MIFRHYANTIFVIAGLLKSSAHDLGLASYGCCFKICLHRYINNQHYVHFPRSHLHFLYANISYSSCRPIGWTVDVHKAQA